VVFLALRVPAATRVAQGAPAAAPATVNMSAVLTGEGPAGVSRYELTITNIGTVPMHLALAGIEPTGALTVAVPSPVTLRGGETQRLPVEVRQVRPATGAARTLQFQISASRDDGSRAGFVNVTVMPTSGARSGKKGPNWLLIGAGGAALIAVAAAAFAVLGGGSSKNGEPGTGATTPNVSTTATVAGTTPAATTPAPSITVRDVWDYTFKVTGNNCAGGPQVGSLYSVSFRFKPATGDANVIRDGERVSVSAIRADAPPLALGAFTFRFQDFVFTYPVTNGDGPLGEATLRTSFADATTIATADLTEKYTSPNCTLTASMAPS